MTSGQHIDYDALALQALRGVVRACLAQVSRTGLLGDHHFYIAFNTQAPGVGMSKRLKEKYPVEMTIVLQHRFWDLAVDDERFEVKLTFDGIPERLVVPFAAVKVFYDPSVPYVLQFEEVDSGGAQAEGARRGPRRGSQARQPAAAGHSENSNSTDGAEPDGATGDTPLERSDRRKPPRRTRPGQEEADQPRRDDGRFATNEPSVAPAPAAARSETPGAGAKPSIVAVGKSPEDAVDSKPEDDKPEAESEASGAKIFDLSKFRGKK